MKVILSGGCFWCIEAIFKQLKNVEQVTSGYASLQLDSEFKLKNRQDWQKEEAKFYYSSAYQNKIEVVEVTYNNLLTLKDILSVHYFTHNPTLTQWGKDCMFPLNRSGIFLSSMGEKDNSQYSKEEIECSFDYLKILTDEMVYVDIISNPENKPISVEVFLPTQYQFSKAEDKQQNYYESNPTDGYCTSIISPKVDKLKRKFEHLLKG